MKNDLYHQSKLELHARMHSPSIVQIIFYYIYIYRPTQNYLLSTHTKKMILPQNVLLVLVNLFTFDGYSGSALKGMDLET